MIHAHNIASGPSKVANLSILSPTKVLDDKKYLISGFIHVSYKFIFEF